MKLSDIFTTQPGAPFAPGTEWFKTLAEARLQAVVEIPVSNDTELTEAQLQIIMETSEEVTQAALVAASRVLQGTPDAVQFYRNLVVNLLQVLLSRCGVGSILTLQLRAPNLSEEETRQQLESLASDLGADKAQEALNHAVFGWAFESLTDADYLRQLNTHMGSPLEAHQITVSVLGQLVQGVMHATAKAYPPAESLIEIPPKPSIILPGQEGIPKQ